MFDIKSIQKGRKELPPRIILLGTPKIGKTTLACGSSDAILIPIKGEEGADAIDVAKFPTVKTFDEIMEALTTLATEEHSYKSIVIDSSSTLEPLVWDETVRQDGKAHSIETVGGGYAKGYIEALKNWRQIMDALDYLRNERGMMSIIIGHVLVKQFNDPMTDPYDQFQWNIHHKAAAAFTQWADCILFAKYEALVSVDKTSEKKNKGKGVGKRKLYTQERPSHPGGGRGVYGHLPYELPLEWDSFIKAVGEVEL